MSSLSVFLWVPPALVFIALCYFCFSFWKNYVQQAKQIITDLTSTSEQVAAINTLPAADRQTNLEKVLKGSALEHCWREYDESLHSQWEDRDGEMVLRCSRATAPASLYFTQQSIVDTRLQTEFFKHLPGILTGLGIIGTFGGLLIGLTLFDTSDPSKIQDSVTLLLHAVRDAFFASGAAIAAAMFVTYKEKHLLRKSYELLEGLTDNIDQLFESGVGEEYLSSLVKNSEESAKQTRMLKDSLVTDLREMLQNLVDSQVRENLKLAETLSGTFHAASDTMAGSISQSIENSFREPLDKIAASVQTASGQQSDQVGHLLQEVLVTFMSKLENTFGSQFNGMQEMMGQSVHAMQQMQSGFNQLVSDMRAASESSGQAIHEQLNRTLIDMRQGQETIRQSMQEMLGQLQQAVSSMGDQGEAAGLRMASQLEKLFEQSEQRQQAMATEMQAFVNSMKDSVGKGQQDIMDGIAGSVERMGSQLDSLLNGFAQNREAMDQAAVQAQQQLQQGTQETVREMGTQVDQLLQALQQEREAGGEQIRRIGEQTDKALSGMQAGAERMRMAAEKFETASEAATALSEQVGESSLVLSSSCDSMKQATRELTSQVAEYSSHREAVLKTLSTLESIVASSKLESDARQKLAQDYRLLTDKIEKCNSEAASYLERVNGVLSTSFTSFSNQLTTHLKGAMGEMGKELDKAIASLSSGVSGLNEHIDELSEVVGKAVANRR